MVERSVTIAVTAGGTTDPIPGTYYIEEGTPLQLTAIPNTGYSFAHWESAATGQYYNDANPWDWTTPIGYSVTLLAVFYLEGTEPPIRKYRFGFSINLAEGAVTYCIGLTCSPTEPMAGNFIVVPEGDNFTVLATANPGYNFVHFITTGGTIYSNNPMTYVVERWGGTFTVVFELIPAQVTLTLQTAVGGTSDPIPGEYLYDVGANITLTAYPDVGYAFLHWLIDEQTIIAENPTNIGLYGDTTITPVFTPLECTIDSDCVAKYGEGYVCQNGVCVKIPPGPCFIATVAYGTPLAPQLGVLRRFRDRCLPTQLTKTYYRLSPPIAEWLQKHNNLRKTVRHYIEAIIKFISTIP